jgi:hypothetical protein
MLTLDELFKGDERDGYNWIVHMFDEILKQRFSCIVTGETNGGRDEIATALALHAAKYCTIHAEDKELRELLNDGGITFNTESSYSLGDCLWLPEKLTTDDKIRAFMETPSAFSITRFWTSDSYGTFAQLRSSMYDVVGFNPELACKSLTNRFKVHIQVGKDTEERPHIKHATAWVPMACGGLDVKFVDLIRYKPTTGKYETTAEHGFALNSLRHG